MTGRGRRANRILAAALMAVLLLSVLPGPAAAANQNGLVVEKLSFRDVLRLYTADKAHFGADALTVDEAGVSNAAKNLAELFAYTVGLNYNGEGHNYNYFGKDITKKLGEEPYTEANLLATYTVEILPYRSGAQALPEGKTTGIRVYLTGYKNAANGVEPVLHYVWQDGGRWYAVKDDNPYYRVSYNGQSAIECPYTLVQSHTQNGTGTLSAWESLTEASEGTVVHLSGCTLVAGEGTASVFAVTSDGESLRQSEGLSGELMAVSDYVQGGTTYQTGPLVYTRYCYEEGTLHRLADGESLQQGTTYRFQVVYDEALVQSGEEPGVTIVSQANGRESAGENFVWYGAEEFLTSDRYNPHTVEFTFTPRDEGVGVCAFALRDLRGSDSRLTAAEFHACVNAPASPAREETPAAAAPAATAEPLTPAESTPVVTAAPTAVPTAVPTAAPTVAPTAVPTQEPTPAPTPEFAEASAPEVTPEPAATPSAMSQATTLPLLTAGGSSAPVTRGALAESLWILSGRQVTGLAGTFTDMPGGYEQAQAVIWAAATGLISGEADGSFGFQTTVSREEAAAIFYRFATLKGLNPTSQGDLSSWIDGALVSAGNRTAMGWALESGLLPLREGNMISPEAPALCGEVTGMIYRLDNM